MATMLNCFLRGKITFQLLSLIVPYYFFPIIKCNKAKSHAVVNTLKVVFKQSRVHFHVDVPLNIFLIISNERLLIGLIRVGFSIC